MYLALKEMKKDKLRFAMIIIVTALIAYLIYFLSSLAFGLSELNKTAIDYWDVQGIVLSESANENLYSSTVEEDIIEEVGLELENAINIISASVYVNDQDDEDDFIDVVLMGVEPGQDKFTAPLIEGRAVESDDEIILSNNLKDEAEIDIGDEIIITSSLIKFEVVGFTADSNYNASPVGYVNRDMANQDVLVDPEVVQQQEELEQLLEDLKQQLQSLEQEQAQAQANPEEESQEVTEEQTQGTPQEQPIDFEELEEAQETPTMVSGVLVTDSSKLEDLEEHELQYMETQEFILSIPGYKEQLLTFGLMIVSLSFISAVIIVIFMYILTMQKKPIFGILKIQGYQNRTITISVIAQTAILVVGGFLIGLVLTIATLYFLPPAVPAAISPLIFAIVTVFAVICSLIGSLFSVRTILKIDPLEAI